MQNVAVLFYECHNRVDLFFFFTFNDIKGRWLVDRKLVEAPPPSSNFIAGCPKAAFLVWFFGDFRCGALLF